MFTKAALWNMKKFAFAIFSNPSEADMEQMQVTSLPAILIMIPQEDDQNHIQFSSAAYDRKKHGAIKFKNIMKYDDMWLIVDSYSLLLMVLLHRLHA